MKRIIICSVIMLGAILFSFYSYNKVKSVNEKMNEIIDSFAEPVEKNDKLTLIKRSDELEQYWNFQESTLIHFVRHNSLDTITIAAARIPQLARHDEFGEFCAEAANIKSQMKHILDNEKPAFASIF